MFEFFSLAISSSSLKKNDYLSKRMVGLSETDMLENGQPSPPPSLRNIYIKPKNGGRQ
jgi:hypothetical protein